MGLPASGKTTFAKDLVNYTSTPSHLVNLDNFDNCDASTNLDTIISNWKEILNKTTKRFYFSKQYDIIIDALVLNKSILHEVIDMCDENMKKKYVGYTSNVTTHIVIHKWNDDRKSCCNNAMLRNTYVDGKKTVISTIKHAPFDEITDEDIQNFQKEYPHLEFKLTHHKVPRLGLYDILISNYGDEDGLLKSPSWVTGGECATYMGDIYSIEPDEPNEFNDYDSMLMKLCPEITYLQYKKLREKCVSIHNYTEHDYYGGETRHCEWVCNLKEMYNILDEMGLIKKLNTEKNSGKLCYI